MFGWSNQFSYFSPLDLLACIFPRCFSCRRFNDFSCWTLRHGKLSLWFTSCFCLSNLDFFEGSRIPFDTCEETSCCFLSLLSWLLYVERLSFPEICCVAISSFLTTCFGKSTDVSSVLNDTGSMTYIAFSADVLPPENSLLDLRFRGFGASIIRGTDFSILISFSPFLLDFVELIVLELSSLVSSGDVCWWFLLGSLLGWTFFLSLVLVSKHSWLSETIFLFSDGFSESFVNHAANSSW